jgi:hypothetical protein
MRSDRRLNGAALHGRVDVFTVASVNGLSLPEMGKAEQKLRD